MTPSSTPIPSHPTPDLAVLTRALAKDVMALTLGTAALAVVIRAVMVVTVG